MSGFPTVPALGTMTLTGGYGAVPPETALEVLVYAVDSGLAFLDTADAYPGGEELVASTFARRPGHGVRVATKIGLAGRPGARKVCGRPEYLRQACETSLRRLRVNALDVLLLHRIDSAVPVEESIGALGELVASGMVREIGVCTADSALLRRAHREHPMSFVQTELSILETGAVNSVVAVSAELGATVMAYSPLRRGLLARLDMPHRFAPDDARSYVPYTRSANERIWVKAFHALAAELGTSSVRLALGWLLGLSDDLIPIPGARTRAHVRANLAAQARPLSAVEADAVNTFIAQYLARAHLENSE